MKNLVLVLATTTCLVSTFGDTAVANWKSHGDITGAILRQRLGVGAAKHKEAEARAAAAAAEAAKAEAQRKALEEAMARAAATAAEAVKAEAQRKALEETEAHAAAEAAEAAKAEAQRKALEEAEAHAAAEAAEAAKAEAQRKALEEAEAQAAAAAMEARTEADRAAAAVEPRVESAPDEGDLLLVVAPDDDARREAEKAALLAQEKEREAAEARDAHEAAARENAARAEEAEALAKAERGIAASKPKAPSPLIGEADLSTSRINSPADAKGAGAPTPTGSDGTGVIIDASEGLKRQVAQILRNGHALEEAIAGLLAPHSPPIAIDFALGIRAELTRTLADLSMYLEQQGLEETNFSPPSRESLRSSATPDNSLGERSEISLKLSTLYRRLLETRGPLDTRLSSSLSPAAAATATAATSATGEGSEGRNIDTTATIRATILASTPPEYKPATTTTATPPPSPQEQGGAGIVSTLLRWVGFGRKAPTATAAARPPITYPVGEQPFENTFPLRSSPRHQGNGGSNFDPEG